MYAEIACASWILSADVQAAQCWFSGTLQLSELLVQCLLCSFVAAQLHLQI